MARRAGTIGRLFPLIVAIGVAWGCSTMNPTANLDGCFNCHKPQATNDFVYSYDNIKVAAR